MFPGIVLAWADIAAVMLVVAGLQKLRRPEALFSVLAVLHFPRRRMLVRVLALVEMMVGAAALVAAGVADLAGAALYVGFAALALFALIRHGGTVTCGCFGVQDVPVTKLHAAFNVLFACSLFYGARQLGVLDRFENAPTELTLYMMYILAGAYASLIALNILPTTSPLRREAGDEPGIS